MNPIVYWCVLACCIKMSCANCGVECTQQCSRCLKVNYCSRDCQVKHWPAHKAACAGGKHTISLKERLSHYFMLIANKIAGNVFIMSAHNPTPGVIFVNINEKLEDFVRGGKNHFAHLSWSSVDTYTDFSKRKYDNDLGNLDHQIVIDSVTKNPASSTVIFVLQDHQHVLKLDPATTLDTPSLVKNYPNPGADWTVVFDV